jgi:hypothetical protein
MKQRLIDAACQVLTQHAEVIRNMPPEHYAKTSVASVPGSTIGQHTRHIINHFQALLSAASTVWTVDYDSRKPHTVMETDPLYACNVLEDLKRSIQQTAELEQCIEVVATVFTDVKAHGMMSSMGRELWFCTHHAIHHQALIKAIALEHHMYIADMHAFGVAPSTRSNQC